MKLREFLIVTWYLILVARSDTAGKNDREMLLRKAAEQLERLAPYRRGADNQGEVDLSNSPEIWRFLEDQNRLDETKNDADQRGSPWEVISDIVSTEADAAKKTDDEKLVIDVIADPRYTAMMQDRIKRGFDIGSASLLTSIAGGLLSGVASASSSSAGKALAGSSHSTYSAPAYGAPTVEHTYSYVEKPFGPWDFKKAIFGTLFQALKAIGGGVLALKGQLVKGGGYLLAGKSKVVSKAGDAITSYGKSLAASVLTEPKPYPPEAYYDHPPVPNIGHDAGYPGSPSSSDDYSEPPHDYSPHQTYNVPSDDTSQGGLLIVTPTKSDLDDHNDQRTNLVAQEKPDLSKLEESFGGPATGSTVTNLLNSVSKGSVGSKDEIINQGNSNVNPYPSAQHPASTYGTPNHYFANHDNAVQNYGNTVQNYASGQENTYQQPQLSSHHHFPYLNDPSLSNQPNVVYPPLQYPANPSASFDSSKLLYDNDDGTSVYTSLSIDTEPQNAPLKVSLLPGALELPRLQPPVDFHGQPQFANHLHGSLGDPLRMPLLNPMPSAYYWQSQGLIPKDLKTLNHKRNVLQRRAFAKRLALYSMLQKMRFY